METNIRIWDLTKPITIKTELNESITKISNIESHIYLQTATNRLYHGTIQLTPENIPYLELAHHDQRIIDMDSNNDHLYLVDFDGCVWQYTQHLEKIAEIPLFEEYQCSRGHTGTKNKVKVAQVSVGDYGSIFITDSGHIWAAGSMPQIGVQAPTPKKVAFFAGRLVHRVQVGSDFAIAIVSKQAKNPESEACSDDDEDVFTANCPQCCSTSQLNSPNSNSDLCPLGVKLQSYDIETTSTSSKNDSSSERKAPETADLSESSDQNGQKIEKNIIFRNTEAAKEFLTRQISRMSSAGEEYFVECTEKPTRIIKENMTNVASFVYEGVRTVGDKVVTLSRHVSGSSDNIAPADEEFAVSRAASRDDCTNCSMSQCESERDFSEEADVRARAGAFVRSGEGLVNCEVWTWGNIIHGQLGIGDIIKRERPMIITKLSNIGVRKVSVQNYHASVLTLDGRAFIWGRNDHNQVTMDTNVDQSSPKLYNNASKDERVKDIISGEYYTALLTNNLNLVYFGKEASKNVDLQLNCGSNQSDNKIGLFRNLLNSRQYTLYNVNNFIDNLFTNFLLEEQKFLEEMLAVQLFIVKPLQKKIVNSASPALFEELCNKYTDLMYFWAGNVQSMLEHSNGLLALCDIIIFRHLEEFVFVYRNYIETIFDVVSIDGFSNISKLIELSPNLCKLRPEAFTRKEKSNEEHLVQTFLLAPLDKLPNYTKTMQNCMKQASVEQRVWTKWSEFAEEVEARGAQAHQTKEFWLNSGKTVDFLRQSGRRLLRDSHKHPIHLHNAGRFSSHRFVLFSDVFLHLNGSNASVHSLSTIWIEPHQEEASQQYQICLKMPEETLVLYTNEAEDKIEWFHTLQNAIKVALNKDEALQPPTIRNGGHTFVKNAFFKDATYTGRWLNGKMHGTGKVQWSDGKVYIGQFSNNQLAGHGVIQIPNIGTYEGFWKENQQNGYGVFTYTNTDVYRGYFKDGQPHGHGSLRKGNFMANAASYYIGDWISGMKNGYGVMDDIVTGEKYVGGWLDNKKHGNGLIITSEGVFYEGYFHQDVLTGQGLMVLEDGTSYEGEFRGTGTLNGKGTLTLPSGHKIDGMLSGSWNEGIKISNGTFTRHQEKITPTKIHKNGIDHDESLQMNLKWKSLFKHCHQVLGVPENASIKNGGGSNGKVSDTSKIWQNVAVYLSNASESLKRAKSGEKSFHNALNKLDIIPPFGREKLDMKAFNDIKNYLAKAFESACHPLGSLLNDLSEAYMTTYGGRAHPLLLNHAISELHYICKRLYEIVRVLFPALPHYDTESLVENEEIEEIVNYQSLLYPLVLPKVHHPLFTLFTLNNEQLEQRYKKRLMFWNKESDLSLMTALSVDRKFMNMEDQGRVFEEAIETLQQLKSTFSPTEKLLVLRQTVEKMTPVAQELLGANYYWNMDDLFPNFLFVVVRARIPDLGSELDFIDNFMDPSLESGELGIMYTTLKASYQQIFKEKSSNY